MALSRQSESENTCVVCFKNVDIFSVGQCDHPVCYECSTRMRVLCRTQECPICRQIIPKAIFTKAVEQYSNLVCNISNYKNDTDHGIYFSDPSLEARFRRLLEHRCKKCARPGKLYDNFSTLSNHLRREHELYFCELCLEHLRIFTWERKAYSRSDLALHRRKGDVDDKSLKGHPLCEFCDRRYFDKDELYRHLRKDHFFCHFCDVDGRNDFYGNYNDLTDHFRKDHFLCDEGDCQRKESYTRVFRSEIDLKAHRTHNHIQGLGKAAAKQARTLELEFQLRPRNDNRGRGRGGTYRGGPRREREQVEEMYREASPVPPPIPRINVENNEEFPSLNNEGGASGNGQQSLARKVAVKNKIKVGSTSRDEEDFPSLGKPTVLFRLSSQDDNNVKIKVKQNYPQASTSCTISQTSTVKSAPGQPRAMVTRVSSTNNIKLQSSTPAGLQKDFPALPSTSMDEFRPQWGRKTEPKSKSSVIKVPQNDFPSLPSVSAPPIKSIAPPIKSIAAKKASSVNIPVQSAKAGIEPDRSKKKKSKLPIDEDRIDFSLPSDSLGIKIPKHISNGDLGGFSTIDSKIQLISRADLVNNNQTKLIKKKPEFDDSEFPSLGASNHVEPDRPFVKKVAEQKKKKQEQRVFDVKENQPPADKHFEKADSSRNNNGNRKSDITFTSSSGETFSVRSETSVADAESSTNVSNGSGHFVQPPSFGARNNALRDLIHDLLGGDADALREFQDISKKFRSGSISAKNYYELVQDLFGTSSFELVFSDLLVLLPDVSRQQDLYEVHKKVSGVAQFIPCAVCGQILAPSDLKHHKVSHTLDNDFPSLN